MIVDKIGVKYYQKSKTCKIYLSETIHRTEIYIDREYADDVISFRCGEIELDVSSPWIDEEVADKLVKMCKDKPLYVTRVRDDLVTGNEFLHVVDEFAPSDWSVVKDLDFEIRDKEVETIVVGGWIRTVLKEKI